MTIVYKRGQPLRLNPSQAIGKGGEADVYRLDPKTALKVFKTAAHPDFRGRPLEQAAAKRRLAEKAQKLRAFPTGLPGRVIAPQELIADKAGKTVGYTMALLADTEPLQRLSNRDFRENQADTERVLTVFTDLHATVSALHRQQIVIGDFNDLNVLFRQTEAYVIDTDSFQFGNFPCQLYTVRFLDPLLFKPNVSGVELGSPYTTESDWYAYSVMLMQSLLFVGPYGGTFRPRQKHQQVTQPARPKHRITVFHPEVIYPKPALPWQTLPAPLLEFFKETFERDLRGMFPDQLLDPGLWQPHARPVKRPTAITTGKLEVTVVFQTTGRILAASTIDGHLNWLFHENGVYRRESGETVTEGPLDPRLTYWLQSRATLVGRGSNVLLVKDGQKEEQFGTELADGQPALTANSRNVFWATGGQLWKRNKWGNVAFGSVLPQQTRLWTGEQFGFGFYRAGNLFVAFTFDGERGELNDRLKLAPIPGQLVEAICTFDEKQCWFSVTFQDNGVLKNRCDLIGASGDLIASLTEEAADDSWLGSSARGAAIGRFLLVPTDEGIVRVEPESSTLKVTHRFPDTAPYVDSQSKLLATREGVYVINSQSIVKLTLK